MTKKEIKQKLQAIRDRHVDWSIIKGDDFDSAMKLLRISNPDYQKKMDELDEYGNGVCLCVGRGKMETRCFYLCSEDMEVKIPISLGGSIDVKQQIAAALREADSERVEDMRRNVPYDFYCERSETPVHVYPGRGEKFDIDHYDKTVDEVVADILKEYKKDDVLSFITQGKGGGCVFKEPYRTKYKQYMAKETKLRYASVYGNRSAGKRK